MGKKKPKTQSSIQSLQLQIRFKLSAAGEAEALSGEHSIIWCPFFFSIFFFFFLEAKQHVSLYNAQLERYHTGGLCLSCLFSLWGECSVDIAECSSEEKHWLQSRAGKKNVLMSEAKKPHEGNSKSSAGCDWHLFCFSLTQVIEGTS